MTWLVYDLVQGVLGLLKSREKPRPFGEPLDHI